MDLLVVAPRGVVLVEIKSYPDGVLDGDARTWRWHPPDRPVRPVAAMREAAQAAGASWEVLLNADAYPGSGAHFRALERLVGRAITCWIDGSATLAPWR